MNFKDFLTEISYEPEEISWFYQENGDWYGEFKVNDISYDIAIKREPNDTQYTIVSIQFTGHYHAKDSESYAKDFNKPMVVANTVAKALMEYIDTNIINILVFKAYAKENQRVSKYRTVSRILTTAGFTFTEEIQKDNYVYFILFRSSKEYRDSKIREFLTEI